MTTILIIFVFLIILILIWALFGGERDTVQDSRDEQRAKTVPPPPEEMFRKRASDRAIEEQFPDEQMKSRRKTDRQAPAAGEEDDDEEVEVGFKLPYLADDIIPDTSRLRVYKRTLVNSEIYAGKGDFNTAISLYEGVKSRTRDTEMRFKIDEDINYLKTYKSRKRRADDKKKERKKRGQRSEDQQELKFKLDGPQTIQIGVIDDKKVATEEVIEKVSRDIHNELEELQKRDIRDIKDTLRDLQQDNHRRMEELEKLYRDQQVNAEKDEERDSGISESIRKEMEELQTLKEELNDLNEKITSSMEQVPEVESKPTVLEARYDQPVPVQIDAKPILDILEKLPGMTQDEKAEKKEGAEEGELPPGDDDLSGLLGEEEETGTESEYPEDILPAALTDDFPREEEAPDEVSRFAEEKDITERTKEEENEDEDFELLQDIIKGKEEDTLTDEEIFDRLISQDQKSPTEKDIEILGEKKDDDDEMGYLARADEEESEDAEFYRNLLKSARRKKRELPILKVSYDFKKLPDEMSLSREKNLLQHSFYRYKPMLEKAQQFIDKRQVRDAINYYKVVMAQNIPPEFKAMIRKNINDLTEYLEKYLTGD